MRKKLYLLLIAISVCVFSTTAQVELPALIGDNMVLQRESTVNLWGKAKPNTRIEVKCGWDEQKFNTTSDQKGEWLVEIKTPEAGGPYQIEINDGIPVFIKNVLIGEVWICTGQSNMEMPIKGFKNQPVIGAQDAIFRSMGKNNIRMFTLKTKASEKAEADCVGKWNTQTASGVLGASATAYFFAERITETLGVPVGIIISAWGGSSILAWMPEASIVDAVSKDRMEQIFKSRIKIQNTPAHLYNGMINPLTKYKAKGFLWYQGEENLSIPNEYPKLQASLVKSWRSAWNDNENKMPFFFVQIAPYSYGADNSNKTTRPLFVESQIKSLELTPNSKMATTTDLGSELCIHPAQKREVGDRLALLAISNTYSMNGIESEFPEIDTVEYIDGKAVIKFKSSQGVAVVNGTCGELIKGFEIAGVDKVFHPAKAYAQYGDARALVVESPDVAKPVAVRYAFRNYTEGDLVNHLGVAAPSFRTDNWDDVY